MNARELRKFFLSIVLPSILAVALFIISFYIIVIPSFERNLVDGKREMIRELTSSAASVISDFYNQYSRGEISEEIAKTAASEMVGMMRYGEDSKDYFWITDMRPYMVMHPYRSELNDTDLSDYVDPQGKKLFVEAVSIVESKGAGFINYIWQWKDDTTRLVSKLSYVEGFDKWDWIIGTGIYLEDVHQEIRLLEKKLLRISLLIVLVISGSLAYIVSESLKIERKRRDAEEKLRLSRKKYKTLIEASASSTLMVLDQRIIFTNQKFNDLCRRDRDDIISLGFEKIFDLQWEKVTGSFVDPGRSVSMETFLNLPDGTRIEVIISVSRVSFDNRDGYIIITREIGSEKVIAREVKKLENDLQLSLIIMNQSIGERYLEPVFCSMQDSITLISELMTRKNREVVFVKSGGSVTGYISDSDLRKRILAASVDPKTEASAVMSAPVLKVPVSAAIYEALNLLAKENTRYLLVTGDDGAVKGYTTLTELLNLQLNTIGNILNKIHNSADVSELVEIYPGVPVLINYLLQCGASGEHLTRVISSISDAFTSRLITLAIEKLGPPPCRFSFIAMGSEGREEQTLLTDQDNAIIIEDKTHSNEVIQYFQMLAKEVNTNLNRVGYRFCQGEVMAMNPKWCQPLSVWKDLFSNWINNSDPRSLLDMSIFFDFRHIFGDSDLCLELRGHIESTTEGKSVFFYHLTNTVIKFKPPVSIFGQIIGEKENGGSVVIDLKKLMVPVTGFIRIYSIFHHINETSSIKRLRLLSASGKISPSIGDELAYAINSLLMLRFRKQTSAIMQGDPPDNFISVRELSDLEISGLKKIISLVNELITLLKSDFRGIIE